jgi:hypothetical protein
VLEAAFTNQGQLSDAFENYSLTIKKYLKQSGLTSWLACRCALNLMFSMFVRRGINIYPLREQNSWRSLWREFKIFFPNRLYHLESSDEENEMMTFLHSIISSPFLIPNATSGYVRLNNDGNLFNLVDIIADHICEGKELPFDWIKCIPLNRMILPLLERCSQRILKVIRNTDDPKVLSGGLIALSSSKFLRTAGPNLNFKNVTCCRK